MNISRLWVKITNQFKRFKTQTILSFLSLRGSFLIYFRYNYASCWCDLCLIRGKITAFSLLLPEQVVEESSLSRPLWVAIVLDLTLIYGSSNFYLKRMQLMPSLETKLVLPLNFSKKFFRILLTKGVDLDLNRLSIW